MAGSGDPTIEPSAGTEGAGGGATAGAPDGRGARPLGLVDRLGHVPDLTPLAAVLVGFAMLAIFRTTLLPGLAFWDTGEAQTVLPVLGTMHPTGFPAFVVLGWLFSIVTAPLGQPAFLMNLMAATLAATAAGATVLVVRRLGVPLAIGIATAVGFALTPITWHISTAADAHALHIALVVALTLALLRWKSLVDARRARPDDLALRRRGDRAIVLAAAVYGVAAANHGLALILAPSIVLFVLVVEPRVVLRPKLVIAAVGAALGVAALLYLELPIRAGMLRAPLVYAHPETWSGFWDIVLAKQFQGDVHGLLSNLPAKLDAVLTLAGNQLGPLVPLLPAALFVTAVRQPKYALFSGSAVVITVVFASSYTNADITRYYLGPVFFVWTWVALLAAALVDAIVPGARRTTTHAKPATEAASAETPPDTEQESVPSVWLSPSRRIGLPLALSLVFAAALLVPTVMELSHRWRDVDQSGNTAAQQWLDQAFGSMDGNAVVICWWSYSTPMWYGQDVQHRRPDIKIIDDSNAVWDHLGTVPEIIDRYLGTRPVYVIRNSGSEIQNLAQRYAIQPVGRPGNLFLVTGRLGSTP